ncbi:strawberry notch family protein [Carboxylicivirga sediminis]|uniref:Strawberry notch family protein n=1 Tax=Carboxylicivirga sediminis TaxID=2006564 RepID=A0A941EZV1_9BACT|nr:strawberry notch family protein [Carboxylicivirga sediminis]MBR8534438.1 strawberry notch family protein [Carboxylicivirga sediminis]
MKGLITIKNGVLYVDLGKKAPIHVNGRLRELGFSSRNNKSYFLTKPLTESKWDYLNGLVQYEGLGMPYIPAAEQGFILNTVVPDSMGYEMHIAIRKVKAAIGKPLFDYVKEKLHYTSEQLIKSLAAEQVDSVALAIYNIEEKNQGIIIGDQTGIGKGRQAAAMIRYGIKQGMTPIFLSEKPNLFSDIYRDLVDIQSDEYTPFIVNARDSKTHIKDINGNIVHQALPKVQQDKILKAGKLPGEYDFVCATYSQFNQPDKKPLKPSFLQRVATDSLIVMDEAHNSSGSSNTGLFMQSVLRLTKGVVFLSATYAKRPDNMPIYAQKTAMSEANMTSEDLVDAIANGGVALQEVLSSQLVLEGQLIRRERSFEGVEVNYFNLDKYAKEHERVADIVTDIIRDIISFQEVHIDPVVDELDDIAAAEGKEVTERMGTKRAGVDNSPYFSKVFNVINQLLFSIKAEAVADHTIELLKQGMKPVVAFASTMGAFVEDLGDVDDIVKSDFSGVLEKGLDSVMQISVRNPDGSTAKQRIELATLPQPSQNEYYRILDKIDRVSVGISVSPIDIIIQKIEAAGFSVGEVTGRKLALKYGDFKLTPQRDKRLKLSDIPKSVKLIMPEFQQKAIVGSEEHWGILENFENTIKQIPKIGKSTKAYDEARKKTASVLQLNDFVFPKLHYFYGGSDWYITEWDGKDMFYGYTILNGDMQNAEFGYISREELTSLYMGPLKGGVELDFFFDGSKPLSYYLKSGLNGVSINTNVAQILRRKKESTNDLFRQFNNNEIDCLLINQSGSTGASAHAIVTDKVPEHEVKKRVMVILQAELNINTEIQKRGRINRTGQVLKPRYDYLISTIPAEKRLMMMLKKKLKSLDANTTSSQKSSEDQLKSDDFLNKYGSKVVMEYLIENPALNRKLGDPLGLGGDDEKTGAKDDEKPLDHAAHKVSGRVAILPIKEQEQFYNDILLRYHDYVDYLKQNDEYDLELETLNLQAETISKKVIKAGKGGTSAFSQDTFMEKCECNVLKKPFKQDELAKELADVLDGRSGVDIRNEIVSAHNEFVADSLKSELLAVEDKYHNLIQNITNEPKFKKAKDEDAYIQVRTKELEDAKGKSIAQKTKEINNRKDYMNSLLMFFTPGRGLLVPALGFDMGGESVKALCLGVMVDMNRKNPFAPSAVKVRIAVADSRRQLAYPCSGDTGKELERIQARTYRMSSADAQNVLDKWNEHTSSFQKSRRIRYIFTGNLLQASGDNGKLVSYTTMAGDVKKGVLMPESWSPGNDKNETNSDAYVVVSAKDAAHYIKSMSMGHGATSENKIGIFRNPKGFKFIIPKGRSTQAIYKDADIINLVENEHGFEMVSGSMTGVVSDSNIVKILELMGNRHGISFKVGRQIYEDHIEPNRTGFQDSDKLTDDAKKYLANDKESFEQKVMMQNSKRLKSDQKKSKKDDKTRKLRLLKLRAKAIIIKQKQAA